MNKAARVCGIPVSPLHNHVHAGPEAGGHGKVGAGRPIASYPGPTHPAHKWAWFPLFAHVRNDLRVNTCTSEGRGKCTKFTFHTCCSEQSLRTSVICAGP